MKIFHWTQMCVVKIMDLKFDYAEALKRQNFNQSQVNAFRDAVKKCETLPKVLTDKQLLLFLNRTNGDIENAVNSMMKHYDLKRKNPQIFTRRDVNHSEIKQSLDNQFYLNLPPTKDYHIVCYHALANSNYKNYNYNPATTCFIMMIDNAINKYGPNNGLILLFDMKNFRLGHLTRNNLRSLRAFFAFMQEGLPCAIEKIHIFNTFPSFNLVMKLISPLMNAELIKKMHLHPSSIDLHKFHAEHLPSSNLPSDVDYNGVCGSVVELHQQHNQELLEMREYFQQEEKTWNQ